ncbi:MAG TPA: glycosyltransferase family 39 protein [Ktedonobacteraceae bacterium]|nr:glycosyltransferase family 39 protein [Ktedonobacteraceae bacterium]
MNLATTQNPVQPLEEGAPSAKKQTWREWLTSWEMYLIVLLASFLRLYRIDTTQFSYDQANIFNMAYSALHHGMLVATSNYSSLENLNPPAIIYLLMPPAIFSSDPLWAAVWFAVLSILAVLITYVFVRRYFGRVAATIAATLFAVVNFPVFYSRFIWNQNLLLLFAPLFIMTLLWAVIERRKGWFAPAIFLLGLMYQLHGSSSLLIAALVVTLLLVPRTISWRDVVLAALGLVILYFPYLLWELHTHFQDIAILLNASKRPSHIDRQALDLYRMLLGTAYPANLPFPSFLPYLRLIRIVNLVMVVLLFGGTVMAGVQVLWPRRQGGSAQQQPAPASPGWWKSVLAWWNTLRADTYRCSLLLLLVWQIVPLLALSRRSIPEFPHYFIFFMPGPYILIALFVAKSIKWLSGLQPGRIRWIKGAVYGLSALLLALLIGAQTWGSLWTINVIADGDFTGGNPHYDGVYVLNSLENAIHTADQLAQQRHLKHLYINSFSNVAHMLNEVYLAEHTTTPATVFKANCLVLPSPDAGPAVLLVSPYNDMTNAVLSRFASATLVDQLAFPGNPPFKLYIVQSLPAPAQVQGTFVQNMQLLDEQRVSVQGAPWLATRWNMLRTDPDLDRTIYTSQLTGTAMPTDSTQKPLTSSCDYTSMQAGDQLISLFPLSASNQALTALQVQARTTRNAPVDLTYHLFNGLTISFATDAMDIQTSGPLLTSEQKDYLLLSIPK